MSGSCGHSACSSQVFFSPFRLTELIFSVVFARWPGDSSGGVVSKAGSLPHPVRGGGEGLSTCPRAAPAPHCLLELSWEWGGHQVRTLITWNSFFFFTFQLLTVEDASSICWFYRTGPLSPVCQSWRVLQSQTTPYCTIMVTTKNRRPATWITVYTMETAAPIDIYT